MSVTVESEKDRLRVNLEEIRARIARAAGKAGRMADAVLLVAVTKTHPVETIQALVDLGVRDIGENRVQEIERKAPALTGDFSMHMVGHLQTNKVADVLPHVKWIQSIDSDRLVSRIEHCNHTTAVFNALVEVNTSGEASKSGCMPEACRALCEQVAQSKSLKFRGLMTIGPLNAGESEVRRSFVLLRKLAEACRDLAPAAMELSMGMSGDFEWAIEEGSTMVRIGTALVGERQP
jgi:PLP dependent protein